MPRMRAALLEPFQLQDGAKADPGLYTGAVELLLATLAYHPSLLDVMLFPTALQGSQDTVRRSSIIACRVDQTAVCLPNLQRS
jgi:hypothetical protein